MKRPSSSWTDSAMMLFEKLFLGQFKRYNLEIITMFGNQFQNCHVNLWTKKNIGFDIIAFLAKPNFRLFSYKFAYNQRTNQYLQNMIFFTWNKVRRPVRIIIGFIWKTSFMKYKIDFFVQIHRFSHDYFRKSGQGGLGMDDSSRSTSNNVRSRFHTSYVDIKRDIRCSKWHMEWVCTCVRLLIVILLTSLFLINYFLFGFLAAVHYFFLFRKHIHSVHCTTVV